MENVRALCRSAAFNDTLEVRQVIRDRYLQLSPEQQRELRATKASVALLDELLEASALSGGRICPSELGRVATDFEDYKTLGKGSRNCTERCYAVAGNNVAGFDEHDVADLEIERRDGHDQAALAGRVDQPLGGSFAAGAAQRVGLRLAASLRHRLREISEQHGEPQPRRDLAGERRGARVGYRVAREQHGHDGGDDLGDEDHRILGEAAWIEFFHGVESGALQDASVEQAGRRDFGGHGVLPKTSCRPASGNARRSARAPAPGNIAADRE